MSDLVAIAEPLSAPPLAQPRKVFVETLGCQMNKADSELMLGLLSKEGFEPTAEPTEADLLILNTCQIRENAEDKAYSYLGRWGRLKRKNPDLKIAMAGCVAQQAKDSVFGRTKGAVDLVFGTQNIHQLPSLVRRVFDDGEPQVIAVDRQKPLSTFDYFDEAAPVQQIRQDGGVSAWVSIIEGCDYFCTYCVVPYTRGRQISRKPASILAEVTRLAEAGYKEVTLLGQTVDAYGKDFNAPVEFQPKGKANFDLGDLFGLLHEVPGLQRIRFMTSHPLDLSESIIEAIAELPKVMENIHIPMQAGDDEVLHRMRRGYTADDYYRLTDRLHQRIEGVTLSGDYIVGFPAETEAQFLKSVYSVARSGVYMANTAAYSARQQTPAAIWEARDGELVPDEVKQERLQTLNEAITKQAYSHNLAMVGQTLEVLVEGPSKRNPNRLMGRTRGNKVVNFDVPDLQTPLVGQLLPIHMLEAAPFSLLGVYEPVV